MTKSPIRSSFTFRVLHAKIRFCRLVGVSIYFSVITGFVGELANGLEKLSIFDLLLVDAGCTAAKIVSLSAISSDAKSLAFAEH